MHKHILPSLFVEKRFFTNNNFYGEINEFCLRDDFLLCGGRLILISTGFNFKKIKKKDQTFSKNSF